MRMKFNKSGQLLLVSTASLLLSGLVTACGTLTVDFVFVASSKAAGTNSYGEIDVFEVNSESGHMRQIPTSPFPSGGRNPVAEAVSSDKTNLYVVNEDEDNIVQFVIGSDGKLYPQNTVDTPGSYPFAVAVSGQNLFVADTYQPLSSCSTAEPCSGSIAVFPILTAAQAKALTPAPVANTLGSPIPNPANGGLTYWPLSLPTKPTDVLEPTAISVLPSGNFLYVAAYDTTSSANYLFGFSIASGGALAPLNGGAPLTGAPLVGKPFATGTCLSAYLNAPYVVGTCPSAIASDSTGGYVYVTDSANGKVHAYAVASSGLLTELGAYPTGNQPSAIVAEPQYLYVTNSQDATVTAYSISSGVLTPLGSAAAGGGTYTTGTQPVAIGIDPSTNHFLYTVNYLGGNVSGFVLSTTTGTLINAQNSPFTANAQPTAFAAIPHGSTQK
jgi:6-phosphogluconolactonase (cycloisomerase 2 family)